MPLFLVVLLIIGISAIFRSWHLCVCICPSSFLDSLVLRDLVQHKACPVHCHLDKIFIQVVHFNQRLWVGSYVCHLRCMKLTICICRYWIFANLTPITCYSYFMFCINVQWRSYISMRLKYTDCCIVRKCPLMLSLQQHDISHCHSYYTCVICVLTGCQCSLVKS